MGPRHRLLVVLAVGALAATGCAGPSVLPGHETAFQRSVKVIKAWSAALRTGHVLAAAHYFQLPSVFVNGPQDAFLLHSRAAAVLVNRLLPCGAKFVSAKQQGQFVNALFTLTDRPGPGGGPHGCGSGAGTTARVDFIIGNGKITHWLRAPSEPGDNRTQSPSPKTATSPGTATVPGTTTAPGTTTRPGTTTVPGPGTGTGTSTGPEPAV